MKQTLLQRIKLLGVIAVILLTVSTVQARPAQTLPAGAPPVNTDFPIHTGGTSQVKQGGLGVQNFIANQNAQFDQQLILRGTVRGGGPANANSAIAFGGSANEVGIASTGLVRSTTMQTDTLTSGGIQQVCADPTGTLVPCVCP